MSIKILMPALSPTMKEGNLAKWLIKKGDKVKAGDVIAEIETDKATMEIEAVDEGTITKILFDEGAEGIAVNTPIAIIGEDSAHNKNVNADNKSDKKIFEKVNDDLSLKNKEVDKKINKNVSENQKIISMREAIREAMSEEMRKNNEVFVIGEEVGEYQGAY